MKKGETKMKIKDTVTMVKDVIGGLTDMIIAFIGIGALLQVIFVGGFLGIDVIGNLMNLVNVFVNGGFAGFVALLLLVGLMNDK
jgi:hypothetical protein